MTIRLKPCRECGSATTVTTLGAFSGEEGPVKVTVDGMPAVGCANTHKRFLYNEFVRMLLDFVADPEKIAPPPPAVKRGLSMTHSYCNECGVELKHQSMKESERSLGATLKEAAPFKIVVRVATYKCEGCGREQVRSNDEVSSSAFKAMAHGFRAVDIHPDR